MYDTSIYVERVIPASTLVEVVARATHSDVNSVEAIGSAELDGAVDAWGAAGKATVLRYWTIPGEFPFAVEILFKQPNISTEQEALAVLHQVAATLNVPLLSIETDVHAAFRAIFPDGTDRIVDEDPGVDDPAIVLTPSAREAYDEGRVVRRSAVSAAE